MLSRHCFLLTICLKPRRIAPTAVCSVSCYTGPDADPQLRERRGANKNQVTKRRRKERPSCQPVLDNFDQQYSQELGDLWPSASSAPGPSLLAVWRHAERFSAVTGITQILQSQGFSTLLPQNSVSPLLCNDFSTISNSKHQAGKDSPFPPDYISKFPPNDFPLQPDSSSHVLPQDLKSEPSLSLPRSTLQCYIHPYPLRFPSQAHRPGQLKQYYLLNAASLLPVLALKVTDGEKVLDLCSAPGGKALAIMQCATPALLCCNEPDPNRREWLSKTLESFLPPSLTSRVTVSAQDGCSFGQSETGEYDKVLVDAPCSNDRSWLYSSSSQQGEQRLKERARLPALQAQLLSSENYAVVDSVLNDCPEAEPEDLWEEIAVPLSKYFTFSHAHPDLDTPQKPSLRH
ncbi:hypothetical protein F7725_026424 [Dissostichus mawsoni]|uniref:SAM-dependent MTase RsmB/NOP-type domain-containing protein n=1 Tax=Dissostichus mawsoni TaxID=36200 RepID=A0A7J5X7Y4_DISMA|nr:hypothetical protein F7725_026424 [Dissostichus mawsoni]